MKIIKLDSELSVTAKRNYIKFNAYNISIDLTITYEVYTSIKQYILLY